MLLKKWIYIKINKLCIIEKIIPPIKPSMLFLGETDFNKGLFPKLTPNTYAAESETHIKLKKQKT